MTKRIAINGLGRIGRCVIRAVVENGYDVEIIAVNGGSGDAKTHAHLLKYDSVHGTFPQVEADGDDLLVAGKKVKLVSERDPKNLPWKELDIDIVLECTGAFRDKASCMGHIEAGAKKVMISAPGKEDVDATIVHGVNDSALKPTHQVISVGSCTTNCLAPIAKTLNDAIGIKHGYMTTIHSYTNDQVILDAKHKDLRRARAAAMSMIPTSTGAAKALSLVVPELKGKLDGAAIRVPTPNVSMVDLTFKASRKTSVEEIHAAIKANANGAMKGVLEYSDELLVSVDFVHNSHSSIFDATQTKIVGDDLVHVAGWYDNEWGFSCRMLDIALSW
ncbi:MAG: type I glyceraldehyde-3-phosphate dehydrogenase [Alphaproteobacteria bacterium CG11_big_fil_rev_8_21_14_0_20_44_7]|nr:MAG: type I glyceraldehyde-3-phosphate dehydrogenase [Alphaproteobacteria bacterium CG11_big_fil_rev_8_21_14_0_20_44_7]